MARNAKELAKAHDIHEQTADGQFLNCVPVKRRLFSSILSQPYSDHRRIAVAGIHY